MLHRPRKVLHRRQQDCRRKTIDPSSGQYASGTRWHFGVRVVDREWDREEGWKGDRGDGHVFHWVLVVGDVDGWGECVYAERAVQLSGGADCGSG